jgi:hypothetical protein
VKYQLEMTPEEQIALYGMVERVFGKFCETLVTMEKIGKQPRAMNVHVEHHGAEVEVEDNDDHTASAAQPSTSEVLPFALRSKDRPTGADVGRGEIGAIKAPQEGVVHPVIAGNVDQKKLNRGRLAFDHLVDVWQTNFGVEGAEQPDRAEAMRSLANGPKSFAVLAYVQSVGGLTHAVNQSSYFTPDEFKNEEGRRKLVLEFAGNMTQVSSILFPDLSDLYEYRDIFKTSEDYDDGE